MAKTDSEISVKFPTIQQCESKGREDQTVLSDMDGTLLVGRSSFPYFALVAFEVGGISRLLFLVLASPLAGFLYYIVSESLGIRVLVFATFVGMKMPDIEYFYSSDLHPDTWRVLSSCGKRCVITANPRIMVEVYLKEYLGVDMVIGTEICTYKGRATGFVNEDGVLVGDNKAKALQKAFDSTFTPHIGIGDRKSDFPFMNLCKESYIVRPEPSVKPMSQDKLPKRIVFHDGRLVQKPGPLMALMIILWIPVGFLLACLRIAVGSLLPMPLVYYAFWALGVRIKVKGNPPPPAQKSTGQTSVLFICSHRTLLDPIFLSTALGRPIPAVTYSLSRLSEIISPIKTVRLSRDRATDANMIKKLLEEGDLVICHAKDDLVKSKVADIETGGSIESEVRTSSGMFLLKAQDEVVANVEARIAAWTFLPEENGEAIQILHYELGQKYEPHYDFFKDKINQEIGGHRVATVLMYLSDVEKGGETVFPISEAAESQPNKGDDWSDCAKRGYAVKPRKGDALLFFSLHPNATTDSFSLHGSCPVIEGEKWSATKWIHVRSFDSLPSTDECVDLDPGCAPWAAAGECLDNPLYMVGSEGFGSSGRIWNNRLNTPASSGGEPPATTAHGIENSQHRRFQFDEVSNVATPIVGMETNKNAYAATPSSRSKSKPPSCSCIAIFGRCAKTPAN
ncbi:putative prolyl 4-hydroxylase 6 [Capsicum annuum]|nr:putative prolyl 4-hydroxylase 6 [Capsicum annuum]